MNQREALEKAEEMLKKAEESLISNSGIVPLSGGHYPQYVQLADKYMALAGELARMSVV